MIPPIDLTTLAGPAQKIAAPNAPPKLQEMAARGIAPGVRPADLVAVLVLLASSENATVRETANKTLAALPEPILTGALSGDLQPLVIDALARLYVGRLDVLEKLVAMPRVEMETIEELARAGAEPVTELVATNEERLLKHPRIIELLYLNKNTRMSTADRIVDLAVRNGITLTGIGAFKEVAAAIQDELIPLASDEPTPDDLLYFETQALAEELAVAPDEDVFEETEEGQEVLKDKLTPLYKRITDAPVSMKIRRALLGTKEERMLLVRDQNKIVASAAARSPLLQETEVAMISRNRNVADEVLRIIASTPEWMKSYMVKKHLVENPKTPVMIASRLIPHLRESDLRHIAKSKNVTGAVSEAAKRQLDKKK